MLINFLLFFYVAFSIVYVVYIETFKKEQILNDVGVEYSEIRIKTSSSECERAFWVNVDKLDKSCGISQSLKKVDRPDVSLVKNECMVLIERVAKDTE